MTEKPAPTKSSKNAIRTLILVMSIFVGINLYFSITLLKQPPATTSTTVSSQNFTKAVPEFTFTNQDGNAFGLPDLKGQYWIAAFFFTRCPGPCPMIISNLAQLHQEYSDSPEIHLVSFSIDPNYDTPEVLTRYAQNFQADHSRWTFLTGDQATIHDLSMNGFYSAVMETTPETAKDAGPFVHGTRIYVVDKSGTIVAAYDGTTDEGVQQTKEKLHSLIGR